MDVNELARGFEKMDRLLDPMVTALASDGKVPDGDDPDRVSMQWAKIVMKSADANADGRLTRDEMLSAVDRFFKSADINRDGALTQRELLTALETLALPRPAAPPQPQPRPRVRLR